MLTRRAFTTSVVALGLSACAKPQSTPATRAAAPSKPPPLPSFYDAIADEPYPVPAIEPGTLPPRHWRQQVANPWPERPEGTIIVDPDAGNLHFVQTRDTALRYGVSVGAEGFAWSGTARLQFCRTWPRWKVPDAMIARQPRACALFGRQWRHGPRPRQSDGRAGAIPVPEWQGHALSHPWRGTGARHRARGVFGLHSIAGSGCDSSA